MPSSQPAKAFYQALNRQCSRIELIDYLESVVELPPERQRNVKKVGLKMAGD